MLDGQGDGAGDAPWGDVSEGAVPVGSGNVELLEVEMAFQ